MNTRRTTLLIAIILAVGTGWLTLTYVSSLRPNEGQARPVLIAAESIPARERITAALFRVEMRPAQSLEPDAISDPARADGSIALVTIPAGSQLTASKIGTNSTLVLPVRLRPGMRAVSIPVDPVKDVSGLIQPGDRVDVIAIPPRLSNGVPPKAVTIFRGIRVLAVGNALESPSATPSPEEEAASTMTLEVSPQQADLLSWADSNATLRLALRSPQEPIRSEPVEQLTLSGNPIGPAMMAPRATLSEPQADPSDTPTRLRPSAVQLIIGDQIVGTNGAASEQGSDASR